MIFFFSLEVSFQNDLVAYKMFGHFNRIHVPWPIWLRITSLFCNLTLTLPKKKKGNQVLHDIAMAVLNLQNSTMFIGNKMHASLTLKD